MPTSAVRPRLGDRLRSRAARAQVAEVLADVRRSLPDSWVPAVVRGRLVLDRRSDYLVDEAREQVAFLLDRSRASGRRPSVAELEAHVADYQENNARRAEMRWHPDLVSRQRIEGLEHLVAARARGRGVVLSFLHHGAYDGAMPALARAGVPLHVVMASALFADDAPAFLRQHRQLTGSAGNTLVDVAVGSAALGRLLDDARVVALALDVVGSTEVRFCGRRVRGSSGAARLAHRHGSPVVAMTGHLDGEGRTVLRLSAPFEPADHDRPEDLLEALLRHHETAVLERPGLYHHPTTRWSEVADEDAPVVEPVVVPAVEPVVEAGAQAPVSSGS